MASEADWTVNPYLLFSFGTFDSSLTGLGRNQESEHVALPKQPIKQFKPVQQSRQQVLRANCPNIYTGKQGDYGGINRFSYSYLPALRGLPDMPTWLKYKYSQRHSSGTLTLKSLREEHACLDFSDFLSTLLVY